MELLETQDPEKKKLIETSERHRQEISREVSAIAQKSEQVLTNALIIGGTLAATYFIVEQLTSSSKSKKKHRAKRTDEVAAPAAHEEAEEPSVITEVTSKILNQAALMLLDIAREKLSAYLNSKKQEHDVA